MAINWKFWRRKKAAATTAATAVVAKVTTVHVCPECGWKYAASGATVPPCPNTAQHPKKE